MVALNGMPLEILGYGQFEINVVKCYYLTPIVVVLGLDFLTAYDFRQTHEK